MKLTFDKSIDVSDPFLVVHTLKDPVLKGRNDGVLPQCLTHCSHIAGLEDAVSDESLHETASGKADAVHVGSSEHLLDRSRVGEVDSETIDFKWSQMAHFGIPLGEIGEALRAGHEAVEVGTIESEGPAIGVPQCRLLSYQSIIRNDSGSDRTHVSAWTNRNRM